MRKHYRPVVLIVLWLSGGENFNLLKGGSGIIKGSRKEHRKAQRLSLDQSWRMSRVHQADKTVMLCKAKWNGQVNTECIWECKWSNMDRNVFGKQGDLGLQLVWERLCMSFMSNKPYGFYCVDPVFLN